MSSLNPEIIAKWDERLVDELVELHSFSFPAHMQVSNPNEYFMDGLREDGTINIVLRSEVNRMVGHLLAYPQSSVFAELRQWDPAMEDDSSGLYLEMIQVLPEQRGKRIAKRLFERMALEAEKRGFKKLSMHARKANRMDEMIRTLFPENRFLRTIENWLGTGEPFEYIETTILFNGLNRETEYEKGS